MKKPFRLNRINRNGVEAFSWVFLSLATILFVFPLFAAIMISFSSRESIQAYGFQLIPSAFSLEAYEILFTSYGESLFRSLLLTISTGLIQPALSIFCCVLMAYPMSRPDLAGKKFWRIYLLTTMLFSAGLVPNYILRTTYLHLKNTVWIFLIPGVGAWTVFLFRTFFMNLDKAMIESAQIDGASKFHILWNIMLPLTKPLIAMNYFNGFLGRWNDIQTNIYYTTDRKLYTFQYLLQEMLRSVDAAKKLVTAGLPVQLEIPDIPVDATRYAMAVISALPVILLFPYIQKYYAKGITMGSTKG